MSIGIIIRHYKIDPSFYFPYYWAFSKKLWCGWVKSGGYDRGHMANDASFDWSMESLNSTYSMINIVPQNPKVNRYQWVKVERYARMVARKLGSLNVINIIQYGNHPKRLKKQNIAIPQGFYKVLYNKEKSFERCFYYKNDSSRNDKKDKLKKHLIECSLIQPNLFLK